MNTDEYIDAIFANMKVIGMLQKHSKLRIRRDKLTIDMDDRLQGIRRWIFKDSRNSVLVHIRNTINSAIRISKCFLRDEQTNELRNWTILRMHEEMRNCETGLQNLKATYMDDSAMVAALDVLIERLRANHEEIARKYDSEPQTVGHKKIPAK